jgi:H+-translocating NAD(P) transhydrogenase subunit alpha
MKSGSVIVDLMADLGGNCELTQPGKSDYKKRCYHYRPGKHRVIRGVSCQSDAGKKYHATLFDHLVDMDGRLVINPKEEITWNTLLCKDGRVTNERVLELFSEIAQA